LKIAPVGPQVSAAPTQAADIAKDAADVDKARRACKDFEAILLCHLLSSMRSAFQSEEDLDGGFGGDIFRSLMDEQLSLALARGGGIGLASMLEEGLGIDRMAEQAGSGEAVREAGDKAGFRRPAGDVPAPGKNSGRPAAAALGKSAARPEEARSGAAAETAPRRTVTAPADISDPRGAGSALSRLRRFEPTIRAAATVFGLSSELIRAVIIQESGGNPRAVSGKGAKGLMQLTDGTARDLGVTNPFDPVQNIFGGARFLASLLKRFGGDLELALASYNAGPGVVLKYGGIPPFKETQDYVKRIVASLSDPVAAGGRRG